MHRRSAGPARRIAPFTGAAVIGFIIWTHVTASSTFFLNLIELTAILAVIVAVWLVFEHRDGFAFAATAVTIAACIGSIFVDLYPNVKVSSTNPAYSLTVHKTASAPYSLKAMTVVAVVFLPLVLGYQAWTYYVFRRRVSRDEFLPSAAAPATADGHGTPGAAARPAGRRELTAALTGARAPDEPLDEYPDEGVGPGLGERRLDHFPDRDDLTVMRPPPRGVCSTGRLSAPARCRASPAPHGRRARASGGITSAE